MSNNKDIIDIEASVVKDELQSDLDKQIKELGEQVADKNGEWVNSKEFGIVWRPTKGDQMGKALGVPPANPSPLIGELVAWGNAIDLENIPEKAVLLIKVNVDDPFHLQVMQAAIVQQVLNPRIEKLKERKICVLFMRAGDDISVMTEEDMNKAGWEKKEKSRIITPLMNIPGNRPLDDDLMQRKYDDFRKNHELTPNQAGLWLMEMTTDRWDYFRDNVVPLLEANYQRSRA